MEVAFKKWVGAQEQKKRTCELLPTKFLYAFVMFSMRSTRPADLTLLDFVAVLIFGE
jgi:hypothetical protein